MLHLWRIHPRGSTDRQKTRGPRIKPWGNPHARGTEEDSAVPTQASRTWTTSKQWPKCPTSSQEETGGSDDPLCWCLLWGPTEPRQHRNQSPWLKKITENTHHCWLSTVMAFKPKLKHFKNVLLNVFKYNFNLKQTIFNKTLERKGT